MSEDIAARRSAEEALRQQASRLSAIISSAMDAIITLDHDQRVVLFNPAAEKMFGCSAADAIGRPIDRFIPRRFREAHQAHIKRFGKTRETTRRMGQLGEVRGLRTNGEEFPIEASISHIEEPDTHYTVVLRDISDRRRSEVRLRESERSLATLIHNLRGAAYRCRNDRDWTMEFASDGIKALTGYAPVDFVERRVALGQLIHPEDREAVWERVQAAVRLRESYQLVYRVRTAKGTEAWIWEQGEAVYGPEDDVVALEGYLTDVTGQREAEIKLREQEALARLGQMAAMVAHEVKNPLAGVRGVLQILRKRPSLSDRDKGAVEEVLRRLSNLDYLLTDVLTYAKPPTLTLEPVAIVPLLRELVAMASHDPALSGIDIQLHATDHQSRIRADCKQLERVFSNLILNAAQAMDGVGHLTVQVDGIDSRQRVAIQDSGPGIPEELRSRIFEPFFTTKHRGSGLGLAICRRVVGQHKGAIAIDCPPGGGTTVTVSLPRV